MIKLFKYQLCLIFILFLLTFHNSFAKEEFSVSLSDDIDVAVDYFPARGDYLLLWLAPEYGIKPTHRILAEALSEQMMEVWMVNIVESLYLPQSLKSLKQLDGAYVADLIEHAHNKTGKKVLVVGDSYAAIHVLKGIHQWQQRNHSISYLTGSILFTPYTYAFIPSLGLQPEYASIVSATNTPIMIFQATGSANIGQFQILKDKLHQHSQAVYSQYMSNIMGLFYVEEPTEEINIHLKQLPTTIKKILPVLERAPFPASPIPVKMNVAHESGIDHHLKQFKGNKTPHGIDLMDVYGNHFKKTNYQGLVTVVNFWATWCPPCVEEIPSLNRFKEKMSGLPVELISINYAEESQTVADFMKKVKVNFPVLLDEEGAFAKKWGVITFPSTFVIDTQGQIKYGVNAAIEWDDPELIEIIKSLL